MGGGGNRIRSRGGGGRMGGRVGAKDGSSSSSSSGEIGAGKRWRFRTGGAVEEE